MTGLTVLTSYHVAQTVPSGQLCRHLYNDLLLLYHQSWSPQHLQYVPRMRKPVFGVSDQVQHKPGCAATVKMARG